MKTSQILIPVLLVSLFAAGCRSHRGNHELLTRELRLLEDEIYHLEDDLDESLARLDSSRRENATMRRRLHNRVDDDRDPRSDGGRRRILFCRQYECAHRGTKADVAQLNTDDPSSRTRAVETMHVEIHVYIGPGRRAPPRCGGRGVLDSRSGSKPDERIRIADKTISVVLPRNTCRN